MGRKSVYQSEEERINARRAKQKEYYDRVKESKRELFSLRALRRYYTNKISDPNNSKLEKHQRRLEEINLKINEFSNPTNSETPSASEDQQ